MSIRTLIGLVVFVAASPAPCTAQKLSPSDRALLVARLWSEARRNSSRWDEVRANWDSALAASLRLAPLPQSDLRFWFGLRRFVALLGDGPAAVVAPEALRSRVARPPLAITSIEGRPFIADYAANDEMRVARPQRLAEILSVQGIPAEDWIRDSILPLVGEATPAARWDRAVREMLEGVKGSLLQLVLRLPGGEQRGVSVTRRVSLTDRWPLQPPAIDVDSLPDGVVVVRLTRLDTRDVVEQFDRALPEFTGVRGLIVDVRRASGGDPTYGYQILARLTAEPFPTVWRRTPDYRPGFRLLGLPDSAGAWYAFPVDTFAPRSDRASYAGPIVALSAATTGGAAEDFLAAFRNTGRGVIMGATSSGSPGRPLELPLIKDWSLRLSVVRDAFLDGTTFSGTGIVPELPVVETVDDWLAGRDAALERARAYVGGRRD
jgi:C-terminal processing protease CtpA/Prc